MHGEASKKMKIKHKHFKLLQGAFPGVLLSRVKAREGLPTALRYVAPSSLAIFISDLSTLPSLPANHTGPC